MVSAIVSPAEAQTLIERLDHSPRRLQRLIAGLNDTEVRAAPDAATWSVATIVAHLRASDAIIRPRIAAMLAGDHPPLPAFDVNRWVERAGYADQPAAESLATLATFRAELVAMLRRIDPADWARTGQHEDLGTITVRDAVLAIVEHEEEHAAQIESQLAAAGART